MTQKEILFKMEDIAHSVLGEVYEGYSGRGMFGSKCWGIVCNDALDCIEEAALRGLRRRKDRRSWKTVNRLLDEAEIRKGNRLVSTGRNSIMEITLTVREIFSRGLWLKVCEMLHINELAVNEGLLDYEEKFTFNKDQAIELGLINSEA